jgi:serine/threonine-protein kinase
MADAQHFLAYDGRFRLSRKIADGGMARVYEAEQLGPQGFAKRIALKVIHPEYAREREWLQLFVDEACLSANLMHGNIVQIYQLGEVQGDFFIAMEFIQGPSLRAIIDRHRELGVPMLRPLAAYAASRVARALDYAHNAIGPDGRRLEIVHRDVSPGNVLVTWDGHIKLGDFGIAKARTSVDPARNGRMLMGKKHYMSPEQMLGLDVGPKSDVFSLGVVLYELLALEPLFKEDITELAIDEVTVHPLPRVRATIPDLEPELEQILSLALHKDPDLRPTAAAIGHALDQWVQAQRVLGTPDRLQEHLSRIFPQTYAPASLAGVDRGEPGTNFSNLRRSVGREMPGDARRSLWNRLIDRT